MLAALRAAHAAGRAAPRRQARQRAARRRRPGRAHRLRHRHGRRGTSTLTKTGEIVGSIDYIAPERVRGRRPGPASDLWALGATLYQAVEGRPPFRQDDADRDGVRHRRRPPGAAAAGRAAGAADRGAAGQGAGAAAVGGGHGTGASRPGVGAGDDGVPGAGPDEHDDQDDHGPEDDRGPGPEAAPAAGPHAAGPHPHPLPPGGLPAQGLRRPQGPVDRRRDGAGDRGGGGGRLRVESG